MDRLRANRTLRTGLWTAAAAVFIFGLTFYATILYVA
jgi:hypothetical protein